MVVPVMIKEVGDGFTEEARMIEVISLTCDGAPGSKQCHGIVGGGDLVGENLKRLAEDVAAPLTSEIEVRVVGETQRSGPVSFRGVANHKFITDGHGIGDLHAQVAGVSFFAIGAQVGESQGGLVGRGLQRFGIPEPLVESLRSAMQVVGGIVEGQGILLALEGESSSADSARHPAYQSAEVGVRSQVILHMIESQHHIDRFSLADGEAQCGDDTPVVDDVAFESLSIRQGEALDRRAVRESAEG